MIQAVNIAKSSAYLLALLSGLLLLPIAAPIVMWQNVRGYADRFASLPGIQQSGGVVTGFATFCYVISFIVVVGGATLVATGSGLGLDGTSLDGAATNPTTDTVAPTPTPSPTISPITDPEPETTEISTIDISTPTPSPTQTPSPTPTPTATPTPTPTATPPPEEQEYRGFDNATALRQARYKIFMEDFVNISIEADNLSVVNYTINASNKSTTLYWTTNRYNDSRIVNEWQAVMRHYAGLSEGYREADHLPVAMIPDRLNFVTLTQDGQVYRTSHVDYMSAWRYTMNTTSATQYYLSYYHHAEPGPGNPDYEPSETTRTDTPS